MKLATVQLDPQQFRQILERLDRIEARLAPAEEESAYTCKRCGGDEDLVEVHNEKLGPHLLCKACKVVVEEVPA